MIIEMFWVPACVALCAALFVIFAKNPIRAVLSLIVTFCSTAVTWLTLDAEFLGLSLILVYVGAVMVLFLFVVMMLDIKSTTINARFTRWLPLGLGVAVALCLCILGVSSAAFKIAPPISAGLAYDAGVNNTAILGELVFTHYLLQFEIAGVLLLVAIIAAIALIHRGPRARKVQNIADQVSTVAADRIRLVDGV
jgi:NADH-quinone oxidoreductase subunit J